MTTQRQDCEALRRRISEETIAESYREEVPPMYFPNGDKWTGYTETDIFGNTYYEAVNKQGQPYRRMELPSARML